MGGRDGPLDPDWVGGDERMVHMRILGQQYVLLPSALRDSADKEEFGMLRGISGCLGAAWGSPGVMGVWDGPPRPRLGR